jgi:hypothetical protein
MWRRTSMVVVALTLFGVMASLVAGTGEESAPAPSFSCALRLAQDGSLFYSPVNFSVPALRLDAAKVSSGRSPYCSIINNSGRIIPDETIRSLDENFTLYIWPNDTAAFGAPRYATINIIIITFDNMGGVAGFFDPSDPDAIYLDYDDLSLDLDVTAHEFQHLIHNDKDPGETIWLNEGCSETGIYACYGGGNPGLTLHFGSYSTNTDNDFTNWNTVSDYGGAGLWTIYNYEHFGGNNFTRALVADLSHGIASYNNQLASHGEDWNSVFRKWVAANWINNHTVDNGEWGYTGVWNYVGHTFLESVYPATCSSAVDQAWSADYVRFEPTVWNRLIGDIQINVTFTSGTPHCAVAAVGKLGTANPDYVTVPTISGNRATALVPNLGGDYAVTCLVISGLGGPCSYTYEAVIVDLTPPNSTLSVTPSKPNGKDGWYVTRPSLGLSANELNYTTYFRWDNGTDVKYTGKFNAIEGEHELHYHSVDRAGNVEAERSRAFKVDLTAPNTTAAVDPTQPDGDNGWYVSAANISLSCDTPGANLSWSWDDGPLTPYNLSVAMIEGVHRFNFHAEDAAGNMEVLRTLETKLDTAAPPIQAALRPAVPDGQNGWYVKTPWLNLTSEEAHHPVIFYRWDDGNFSIYKGDVKPPAGEHTVTYYAVDEGGNQGPQANLRIKVDTVPPVVGIEGEPLEPTGLDGWFNTPILVNFTVNETQNVTVYYRWDDNPEEVARGPIEVPEGIHTIYYHAVDEAGNKAGEKTARFKMDTIAPATVLSVSPDDLGKGWFHFHPQINLSTEPGAYVQYLLDGGPLIKYIRQFEIGEGEHNLSFFSSDQAGNWEKRQSRVFKVDTIAPQLTVNLSRDNITTAENVTVTAAADDYSGIQDYLFDFGDGSVTEWTTSPSATRSYALAGSYTIKVRARDRSGLVTVSQPMTVNVRLPPKPPPTSTVQDISVFFSRIPVYVYYLIGIIVVAAIAGAAVGQVMKGKRRARLYIEVEKAEQERERRHTMEIHDDDPLGLPRIQHSPGQADHGIFQGSAAIVHSAPPDARAGTPSYGSSPSVVWEDGTASSREPTTPYFGGTKVIQRPVEEEVVYVAEVGAPVPIWASSAKKYEPPAMHARPPATHPRSKEPQSRPASPEKAPLHYRSLSPEEPSAEQDIERILKKIEEVRGR